MTKPLVILDDTCCAERNINSDTFKEVLLLALEITPGDSEGSKIGTLFAARNIIKS